MNEFESIAKTDDSDLVKLSSALRSNCRSLLLVGSKGLSPDGKRLLPKSLKGSNGVMRCKLSPLAGALRRINAGKSGLNKVKVLMHLDRTNWDRLELSVQSVGSSVLTCTELQPCDLKDKELLTAFDTFKVWWVSYALRSSSVDLVDDPKKPGSKVWQSKLPYLENAIGALKCLSAWAGWYAADYSENEKPKYLPDVYGAVHASRVNTLSWFGGRLSHLRNPRGSSKELVHALCQIKTFGRALPPAFGDTLLRSGVDCLNVLCREYVTDPELLDLYEEAGMVMGCKLPKVGYNTHTSLHKTGCFNNPGLTGGKAGELCPGTQKLIKSIRLSLGHTIGGRGRDDLSPVFGVLKSILGLRPLYEIYDLYGRVLLRLNARGRPMLGSVLVHNVERFQGIIAEFMRIHYPKDFLDYTYALYLWPDSTPPDALISPGALHSWLNHSLGLFLEQYCIADLLARELVTFSEHPSGVLGETEHLGRSEKIGIPFWAAKTLTKLVPIANLPCKLMVLGEPGFKARPLTLGLASANCIMQTGRFLVEPIFHADPRVKLGFEEVDILWQLNKKLGFLIKNTGIKDPLFISSDFKASTDYLPLDLIRAMWKGFWAGQGLPKDHPLWVVWDLIHYPRVIQPGDAISFEVSDLVDIPGSPDAYTWPQKRGSFMGEPFSFLNLTLYNLLTLCLATTFRNRVPRNWDDSVLAVDEHLWEYKVPAQIVGDDVIAVADEGFDRAHKKLVHDTGMVFSAGKDLRSHHLLILCEDVAWWNPETRLCEFLDVVKIRLLTRMTRLHSDHRSAILGKGAQVNKYTGWNENPMVSKFCRVIYMDTFSKELNCKKFLGRAYPWELPHQLGGINLPDRSWPEFAIFCDFQLRFLQWVYERPIAEFLGWYNALGTLAGRRKKGVDVALEPGQISEVFKGYRFARPEDEVGTPTVLFSRQQVVRKLGAMGCNIPVSPFTGFPINTCVLQEAEAQLGMVPCLKMIESLERNKTFSLLFEDSASPPVKLTFTKYQRSLHHFWKKRIGSLEMNGYFNQIGHPIPEVHQWTGFEDIRRKFAYKASSFVRADDFSEHFLKYGPSLRLNYPHGNYKVT